MVSGVHISKELRATIVHHVLGAGLDARQAYEAVFKAGLDIHMKYDSFRKLVKTLLDMDAEQIETYLKGPVSREVAGRKRKFGNEVRSAIVDVRLMFPAQKFAFLQDIFNQFYSTDDVNAPSKSTISRMLHEAHITSKVVEKRNVHADPQKQLEYLLRVAHVCPWNIIDVDESHCDVDSFRAKYGWSPAGQPAYQEQFIINGRSYSVIAAYSPVGFLCWSVYSSTVTASEFLHFLTTELYVYLHEESHVILDNATIHKTAAVQDELAHHTSFDFCAPYSPELKPIEMGFGAVKRYLRDNEAETVSDPVVWLNRAFARYSVHGERGGDAEAHWRGYFANHKMYMENAEAAGQNENNSD